MVKLLSESTIERNACIFNFMLCFYLIFFYLLRWVLTITAIIGEVAGGLRSDSPLIDVEAMSDEESEHINKEQAAVVGQSMQRDQENR